MTRIIPSVAAFAAMTGEALGQSDWIAVGEARIGAFADATLDHQWIHVDPARAAAEGPYGAAVAHGFLTLSLIPHLREATVDVADCTRINYGLDRVRFPAPVRAGTRIRASFRLLAAEPRGAGLLATIGASVEAEGEARPACTAEMLILFLPLPAG